MIVQNLERRVLAAVRFVNAVTGSGIADPLRVSGPMVLVVRNRSGLYVIREADGFDDYTLAFAAPPAPPAGARRFTLSVEDPKRRFLPRSFGFTLPRKSAPQVDAESMFAPLLIDMYPAAASPTAPNWALLRVRVELAGPAATGLANALVRLAPKPAGLGPQISLTDANGEALLAVPGAPPVLPAIAAEFDAAVRVVLDPAVVRTEGTVSLPLPDPRSILERSDPPQAGVRVVNAADAKLAAGRSRRAVIEVPWP